MLLKPVTTIAEAKRIMKLPVLAIDLGFGSETKTCGLSNSSQNQTFNAALEATAAWICEQKGKQAVLIIEAPLSGAFANGNPVKRHDFEMQHDNGHTSDRRWHIGPGGAMALAAAHFLRLLIHKTRDCAKNVHLVEGFASRYGRPKPSHVDVACALELAWRGGAQKLIELTNPNLTYFATLGLFESRHIASPPVVLRLSDNLVRKATPLVKKASAKPL